MPDPLLRESSAVSDPLTRRPGIILIPARNEAATLPDLLDRLHSCLPWEIVVIDDASTDDTAIVARNAGVTVLPLPFWLGAWGATQTGLRYAQNNGYPIAVTIDADGQHQPETILEIATPVLENRMDVAIGSCITRGSWARRITWKLFRLITALKVQDLTSGMRAYNQKAIRILCSADATLLAYQDMGVLARLKAHQLCIDEVPVDMRKRQSGHSRIFHTWRAVLYYLVYTAILVVSKWSPR